MDPGTEKCLIIYDGYCRLCNWWVRFLLKHDRNDVFRFVQNDKISSDVIRSQILNTIHETLVVQYSGHFYYASDAIIQISRIMPFPWRMFRITSFIPKALRDRVYFWVARNRLKVFGKYEACPLIPDEIKHKFPD